MHLSTEDLAKSGDEKLGQDASSRAILREAAQQVEEEIEALRSIFGEDSIDILPIDEAKVQDGEGETRSGLDRHPDAAIRLSLAIPLDSGDAAEIIKVSAMLPAGYPQLSTPPQFQLLNRYIGSHGVDEELLGQVLRLYHHGKNSKDHVEFHPGEVILFDGIEKIRELVEAWYSERETKSKQKTERRLPNHQDAVTPQEHSQRNSRQQEEKFTSSHEQIAVVHAPAITDRKSVFVGHCATITDPSQISLVLTEILKDRKVARSSHPTIHAWVCKMSDSGVIYRDCDDDGETAAGGRLAHLLDLLHLENVIVVVTRW
jgi:hypothetical protein